LRDLERAVWIMDSPRFDLEWFFKGELNRVACSLYPDLKVVMLGQGADEFAGGYSSRLTHPRSSWADYLRDEVEPNLHLDQLHRAAVPSHVADLLSYRPPARKGGAGPYHQMMQLLVRQLQHHNLWHEDRNSSWYSLEARVPFLDHRIVEFLASIPESLHQELFWKKQIVRDAMRRMLPSYDIARSKVGFVETNDMRSIELIQNRLVQRIVPAFYEQYIYSSDLLFARAKIDALARRVVARSPGYFQDAKRLLDCIAISAFERQLRSGDASRAGDDRCETPQCRLIQPEEWVDIDAALMRAPVVRAEWNLDECLALHDDAEVVVSVSRGRNERYALLAFGQVCAQIEVPPCHGWLRTFLSRLNTAGYENYTIRQWIKEVETAPQTFLDVLDLLYQCGFVLQARRDSATRGTGSVAPLEKVIPSNQSTTATHCFHLKTASKEVAR